MSINSVLYLGFALCHIHFAIVASGTLQYFMQLTTFSTLPSTLDPYVQYNSCLCVASYFRNLLLQFQFIPTSEIRGNNWCAFIWQSASYILLSNCLSVSLSVCPAPAQRSSSVKISMEHCEHNRYTNYIQTYKYPKLVPSSECCCSGCLQGRPYSQSNMHLYRHKYGSL